jgi:outer membrane receptor protein involved in Fe transport
MPVLAQANDNAASSDIIVTARRSEERLQDVPISITVLNTQEIANRNRRARPRRWWRSISPTSSRRGRMAAPPRVTAPVPARSSTCRTSNFYIWKASNLLDLNANWRNVAGAPVDLAFFMTNVTNEERILFPGGAYNTIGADGGHLDMPRMFGFRLKY